jgi:hypothetical protein
LGFFSLFLFLFAKRVLVLVGYRFFAFLQLLFLQDVVFFLLQILLVCAVVVKTAPDHTNVDKLFIFLIFFHKLGLNKTLSFRRKDSFFSLNEMSKSVCFILRRELADSFFPQLESFCSILFLHDLLFIFFVLENHLGFIGDSAQLISLEDGRLNLRRTHFFVASIKLYLVGSPDQQQGGCF